VKQLLKPANEQPEGCRISLQHQKGHGLPNGSNSARQSAHNSSLALQLHFGEDNEKGANLELR